MQAIVQRIKLIIIGLFVALAASLAAVVSTPAYVSADPAKEAACEAISPGTWNAATGTCGDGEARINNTVENLINLFSIVVGIIAVIMIIVGGFLYVTSGGDSSKLTNAKNTIIYAVIGLVIAVLAQVIVQFVLDQAT